MNTVEAPTAPTVPCLCCGTVGTEKRTITVEIPDNLIANVMQADGSRQGVPLALDPATSTWSGTASIGGQDVEIRFSIPASCTPIYRCAVSSGDEAFAAVAKPLSLDPFRVVFAAEIGGAGLRIEVS